MDDNITVTIPSTEIDDMLTTTLNMSSTLYSGNVTISTPSSYSIGATGSSGAYLYSTAGSNGTSWTNPSAGLKVSGPAEFDGDVKIKGRSLEKLLTTIEDRLAILQDPDPKKLEKYAALKKAYDHYKTLERLIGDD